MSSATTTLVVCHSLLSDLLLAAYLALYGSFLQPILNTVAVVASDLLCLSLPRVVGFDASITSINTQTDVLEVFSAWSSLSSLWNKLRFQTSQ